MVTPVEEQPETTTVDALLTGARARLDRVQPQDLAQEIADGAIVIDTRDSADPFVHFHYYDTNTKGPP